MSSSHSSSRTPAAPRVFRNANAMTTPMPESVRAMIDGKEVTNDTKSVGIFSVRLSLSTNPTNGKYVVPGDKGNVELAAAQGNLVVDMYDAEIVNDEKASDEDFAAFQAFMGKYRTQIPVPVRKAAAKGLIPVYRGKYTPKSTNGKKKRAYIPLGLLAGFASMTRHGMSFEDDDRFFWPVVVKEGKQAGRVVAVIFGAINADDPVGGFKKGKHRICILEMDDGAPLSALDTLAAAVFDSGWLESDTAILCQRFPGFKPESKAVAETFKAERGTSDDDSDPEADFKGRDASKKKGGDKDEKKSETPTNAPVYRWCTSQDCSDYHLAVWGTDTTCQNCGKRIGVGRAGGQWQKAIDKDIVDRGSDPRTPKTESKSEAPAEPAAEAAPTA